MPIAKKNIPNDFLEQMQSNLVIPSADKRSVEDIQSKSEINQQDSLNEKVKKDKYADVMNVRLSKGRRNEIKAFCASCGVSVTQYIESSFEFLVKEVTEGNIVISKGGITKIL